MKPDVPPSYESAVSREAWTIIAPWISSSDLCSACLVSRKWYAIFVPFLWGDPASHFGIENDAVYVALTRFKRSLRKARLSVRSLTHTLHLPPALSEIYGGPNPTWLRDVLEFLPNLQSLIVTKLPFFDHHSLNALRFPSAGRRLSNEEAEIFPTYGLKLLLASSEPNTTSSSLANALPRFPSLVYLDLSYTSPARDAAVLIALSYLPDLQVLKLRGVGLKDGEAEVLANAIGIRVRLLDLRDNLLTDMAVRSLMQACFLSPDAAQSRHLNVEDWPVGMAPGPDFFSLDTLRSEELDHELLKQLTKPLTGRLAFEDIPHRGLTHLYISGNRLSVEGLSSLLKSERLHILDGGSVDTVKTIARTQSLSSPTGYIDEVRFPGAEKLIPVLARSASKNLTYLRVDHTLVTAKFDPGPTVVKPKASSIELAGSEPLAAELPSRERQIVEAPAPAHYAVEMPVPDQIFELDATPAPPRAELIGDVIYFALSPPIGEKPEAASPLVETHSPIRGEGPYAPEVVNGAGDDAENEDRATVVDSEISDETGTHSTTKSILSPVSPMTPHPNTMAFQPLVLPSTPKTKAAPTSTPTKTGDAHPPPAVAPPSQPNTSLSTTPAALHHRQARIEALLAKRPPGLSSRTTHTGSDIPKITVQNLTSLHPAVLPNLRTLILTDVPTTVPKSSPVIPAIKAFISACADEAALARLLARTDYSLPPGRARHIAELEHARSLFALRTIILEMEEPTNPLAGEQRRWQHSRQRISMSKSSTGDRDSENLWSAAENDFSFFGEEGEEQDECGIYQHDPEKYFPTAHFDDKILLGPEDNPPESGSSSPHGSLHGYGTLSPFMMNYGGSTGTIRSPRNLPLGRNRRSSNESQRNGAVRSVLNEMQGAPVSPKFMNGRLRPPSRDSMLPPTSNPVQPPEEEKVDVIADVAAWRKERKKAYEDELARYRMTRGGGVAGRSNSMTSQSNGHGNPSSAPRGYGYGFDHGAGPGSLAYAHTHTNGDSAANQGNHTPSGSSTHGEINDLDMKFVEGHWKGEIKVIRNATPKGRTGVVDMYGNYFEKGYLYP
ncbi:Leucine Rich Repeat domain protein [Fonsecaea pedrosoi]|nr:Leucine Rich Repeat domain protein [Fonsecaea pedrosoi]